MQQQINPSNQQTHNPLDGYMKLDAFCKKNASLLKPGQFAWWNRNRKTNGLVESGAIIKISEKIYVNELAFADWFKSHIEK